MELFYPDFKTLNVEVPKFIFDDVTYIKDNYELGHLSVAYVDENGHPQTYKYNNGIFQGAFHVKNCDLTKLTEFHYNYSELQKVFIVCNSYKEQDDYKYKLILVVISMIEREKLIRFDLMVHEIHELKKQVSQLQKMLYHNKTNKLKS